MKNLTTILQIKETNVSVDAEERFFKICAFNLADAGQRKMEAAAYRVREHLQAQMNIQAAVRFWESPVLDDDRLLLGDVSLQCAAFRQIPADAIKGAFVYLLTIGETDIEAEGSIMTELYHDIWGTAYVESALQVLRKEYLMTLLKAGQHLSETFGPGYYGMAMEEGRKLYSLIDGDAIGVEQKTSGLLLPEKSCMGLVLVYDRNDIKMPRACEKCLGVSGGCPFCDKRSK